MERSRILQKIKAIDNLPTLPNVALSVNRLLRDYDTPIEDIVALIEKDQSMVMKILRLVNSSFFGFKSKVNSIGHAVTLLGFNTVQNAVVTVSVIEALAVEHDIEGFAIDAFWEHSISVAIMSRYLAAQTKLAPPEDAFTAGLLHDIGKVIWVNYFPDFFVRIFQAMQKDQVAFFAAEKKLGLPSHSLIGSILAKQWMLPSNLAESIKYHHLGNEKTFDSNLPQVVSMGNSIFHMMNGDADYELSLESYQDDVRHAAVQLFKNNPDWPKTIQGEIADACELFKLEVA